MFLSILAYMFDIPDVADLLTFDILNSFSELFSLLNTEMTPVFNS